MYNLKIKILLIGLLLPVLALACRVVVPNNSNTEVVPPVAVTAVVLPDERVIQPSGNPVNITSEDTILTELYNRVNPAVVNIQVYGRQENTIIATGEGSGFIYDGEGNIVTNAHVVHGAEQVEVVFWDGSVSTAEVIGEDLSSDLAVIQVADIPEGVQSLPLGTMDEVAVGQTVVAIGNPFGWSGTLTRGIISAVGRTIRALNGFSIPQSIQTDAAINPGNSGGPLLNLRGEVIGVNAQIETQNFDRSNSGIGFAIPVSIISKVVPALLSEGEYTWPWLGVRGYALQAAQAEVMNISARRGAYISEVISGGPSEQAGLQGTQDFGAYQERTVEVGGDVITTVDGRPVRSFDDLLSYLSLETTPGQDVELTLIRNGEEMQVTVTLEPRPASIETPSFFLEETPQP